MFEPLIQTGAFGVLVWVLRTMVNAVLTTVQQNTVALGRNTQAFQANAEALNRAVQLLDERAVV